MLQFLEQPKSTGHIAGGAEANYEGVFTLRRKGEKVIERGHAYHAPGRQAEFPRDILQELRSQKVVQLLRCVKDLDQHVAGIMMAGHRPFQHLFTVIFGRTRLRALGLG